MIADIPPFVVDRVRAADIDTVMEVMNDDNPIHDDPELAAALGLRGPVNQGPANLGYVLNMLIAWAGDPASILEVRVRFESISCPGDQLIARGRVESIESSDDGPVATCSFTLDRDRAERILAGSARVIAPDGPD